MPILKIRSIRWVLSWGCLLSAESLNEKSTVKTNKIILVFSINLVSGANGSAQTNTVGARQLCMYRDVTWNMKVDLFAWSWYFSKSAKTWLWDISSGVNAWFFLRSRPLVTRGGGRGGHWARSFSTRLALCVTGFCRSLKGWRCINFADLSVSVLTRQRTSKKGRCWYDQYDRCSVSTRPSRGEMCFWRGGGSKFHSRHHRIKGHSSRSSFVWL